MSNRKGIILIALIFIAGFLIFMYPTFSDAWNRNRDSHLITEYQSSVEDAGEEQLEEELEKAEAYNKTLLGGQVPDAFAQRDGIQDQEYESLLNINNIAIYDTINNIDSGVIIFKANGQVSYKNMYTNDLPFLQDIENIQQFISAVSEASGQEIPENFSAAEIKCGDEYYSLKQSDCDDNSGKLVARTVTITNVTEYHEHMIAEKQLSLEQERNRIAQEMHDSAGHTFTMISALARMLKSDVQAEKRDTADTLEKLSEIDGLSRSGVTQLRCTINNLRDQQFMASVTNAVQSVITAVRSVETELCIQGEEDERYQFCIREIYENCRETITNTLRYSNADKIDIILKFLPDRLELHILDNGDGCGNIEEHNGLQGIRNRTEKLGGEVRFMSVANEGFHTSIRIPVREVKI